MNRRDQAHEKEQVRLMRLLKGPGVHISKPRNDELMVEIFDDRKAKETENREDIDLYIILRRKGDDHVTVRHCYSDDRETVHPDMLSAVFTVLDKIEALNLFYYTKVDLDRKARELQSAHDAKQGDAS